jgi:transposase
MSVHPQPPTAVPADTAAAARAAFRRGNPYVAIRDRFGALFTDTELLSIYGHAGAPAYSPARLATVTLLQYAEGLSDAQAADAARSRIDWKYLLGLPLADPGFDPSVLSDFRARLIRAGREVQLLAVPLTRFTEAGLLAAGGIQRTDSLQVLAAVRDLSRLELVEETVRMALEALAVEAPNWLQQHADPTWGERYETGWRRGRRRTERQRLDRATQIGADGHRLLDAVAAAGSDPDWNWLGKLSAVTTLARVWAQQYDHTEEGGTQWRADDELVHGAEELRSPHDVDARYSEHGRKGWVGYAYHVTETADQDPSPPHHRCDHDPRTRPRRAGHAHHSRPGDSTRVDSGTAPR